MSINFFASKRMYMRFFSSVKKIQYPQKRLSDSLSYLKLRGSQGFQGECVSQIAYGGRIRPGAADSTVSTHLKTYLDYGGNIVHITRGYESEMSRSIAIAIARKKIVRKNILICSSIPLGELYQPNVPILPENYNTPLRKWFDEMNKKMIDGGLSSNVAATSNFIDVLFIDMDISGILQPPPQKRIPCKEELYAFVGLLCSILQQWSEDGLIGSYGLKSKFLSLPETEKHSLSLEKLLNVSEAFNSHLCWIQGCVNILHSGMLTQLNSQKLTKSKGIGMMFDTPLEWYNTDGEEIRLVDYPDHPLQDFAAIKRVFNGTIMLEKMYPAVLKDTRKNAVADADFNPPDVTEMEWTQNILQQQEVLNNFVRWEYVLENQLKPKTTETLRYIGQLEWDDPEPTKYKALRDWAAFYRRQTGEVFQTFNTSVEFNAKKFSQDVKKFLDDYPQLSKLETLEQKAFAVALSCPDQPILFTDKVSTIKYVFEAIPPKCASMLSNDEAMQLIIKCEDKFRPSAYKLKNSFIELGKNEM